MARLLEDGDELSLPWDDLADGRVWQLVRGRDFFCNPREVDEAAKNAATRLGKAVQTVRSLHASVSSIWVQFADYRIEPGSPCPCGSSELRRVNDAYAICAGCGASLLTVTKQKGSGDGAVAAQGAHAVDGSDGDGRLRIFLPEGARIGDERKRLAALRRAPRDGDPQQPESAAQREEAETRKRERGETKARLNDVRERMRQEAAKRRSRRQGQRGEAEREAQSRLKRRRRGTTPPTRPQDAGETLDRFTSVRLWLRKSQRPGQYWGCGYDRKGRFVLLEVTLKLTPTGIPVEDPGRPGRALHTVSAVRAAPFSPAVDADALLARPGGMLADDVLGLGPR